MLAGPWGYSETEIAAAPPHSWAGSPFGRPAERTSGGPFMVRLNLAYRVAGAAAIRA